MIQLSRRAMIKDGLLAVSAGMILPSVFARAVRAAHNAAQEGNTWAQAAQQRTLIVVQMAGGNDGLNTIVPYTDGAYYQARPTLAVKPADVIPLNDRLGMHPALAAFKPLWQAGKLAVVEGVGYPNPNLSHFVAMDIWQTLDLNGQGASGWLGKYVSGLVDQDGHPFQSLAVGSALPTALRALNADVPVVADPKSYRLLPDPAAPKQQTSAADARVRTLLKLYNTYPRSAPYAALLDATAQTAVQGSQTLESAATQYTPAVQYPNTNFARGLQVLAEVIAQGLGLRVGYVTIGGFDTHAGQAKTHETLMTDLSEGLAAFYADLQAHNAADNVVVMTWSEFGRRVHENGNAGTDHGTAAPLFVLGSAVRGGIFGEPPDLNKLDNAGNLNFTVDFRSVYATVLDRWLGAPAGAVLGGSYGDQAFLPPPA
ncbi:MAG TPA: DUF1501 domain-containing protein [Ktedonobacterales bacterium]|jgi:uncharacterized protein (DUF1501 family)|nr:DUF1501 domain-containing protein [Ktedonobacterales bacterium]